MTDRAQVLESLLTHPGWRVFLAHVEQEWGASGVRYNTELDKALGLLDDNAAASQARPHFHAPTERAFARRPREEHALLLVRASPR